MKSSPPARPSYMPAGAFCGSLSQNNTVKSRKFEVLGTSGFIASFNSSENRKVDIKYITSKIININFSCQR